MVAADDGGTPALVGGAMADILIAIDGTGPFFDDDYEREMKRSFVRLIHDNSGVAQRHYLRGPSVTGVESGFIGLAGLLKYLEGLRSADKREPIDVYITGYSRGAMIAVYVANRINDFNRLNGLMTSASNAVKRSFGFTTEAPAQIRIRSMILFDAVDSDATMAGPGICNIPSIVETVDHFICRESSARLPRSRWYFDRIDLVADQRFTKLTVLPFGCTHAAIGGLPGAGDHRTPWAGAPPKVGDVLQPGAQAAAKTLPMAMHQPIVAAGAFAYGSANAALGMAGRLYDSVKSNVTLEEDWTIYKSVLTTLRQRIGPGWKTSLIPEAGRAGV